MQKQRYYQYTDDGIYLVEKNVQQILSEDELPIPAGDTFVADRCAEVRHKSIVGNGCIIIIPPNKWIIAVYLPTIPLTGYWLPEPNGIDLGYCGTKPHAKYGGLFQRIHLPIPHVFIIDRQYFLGSGYRTTCFRLTTLKLAQTGGINGETLERENLQSRMIPVPNTYSDGKLCTAGETCRILSEFGEIGHYDLIGRAAHSEALADNNNDLNHNVGGLVKLTPNTLNNNELEPVVNLTPATLPIASPDVALKLPMILKNIKTPS